MHLPSGGRVDVDLLYERLPAYYFLCECFNHVGLGCYRYFGESIQHPTMGLGFKLKLSVQPSVNWEGVGLA